MKNKTSLRTKMEIQYGTLILPAFILFSVGIILPIFMCLYYSLTEWDGFSSHIDFVGLQNYLEIFQDPSVKEAWKFTIIFAVINAFLADILTLLLAVLFDKAVRFAKVYRAILFIPCLFSSIVTGFVWNKIYAVVLPGIMEKLHLDWNVQLLGNADTVIAGLTIANVWQWTGLWMMIYLAALQSISTEYYEAARIDGAGEIQTFVEIVLPIIKPGIGALAIFTFINSWNDYFLQLIMLNSRTKLTISLGIAKLQAEMSTDFGLIMAGAALAAVPIITIFLLFQQYFTKGITMGAVKG